MPVECYTTGQLVGVDDPPACSPADGFAANARPGPARPCSFPLLREGQGGGRPGLRVEKVFYGPGTPMAEVGTSAWLREHTRYPTPAFVSKRPLARPNDGAQLGYQCTEMARLAAPSLARITNLIEGPVGDDGHARIRTASPATLLVTCMQKFEGPADPLIPHRGTTGRVFTYDCPCGLSGPRAGVRRGRLGTVWSRSWGRPGGAR